MDSDPEALGQELIAASTYRVKLHGRGPALWPEHKPLPEIEELRATTPALIWSGTYQGLPTPPGGFTFRREWWRNKNRYNPAAPPTLIARFQSWDTAEVDTEKAAYSVCITGGLTTDYRLIVESVYRARLIFPELPPKIERRAAQALATPGGLKAVLIEDKSSGVSAYQTLRVSAPKEIGRIIIPFTPKVDKVTRANQAALWAANGSILLPYPGPEVPWLLDFEDEIFDFPQGEFKDQVDAFSQLVIYCENYLASGLHKRKAA
jgi:predicted phage terminase large subunit-like protein